ncbi:hypothetical protein F4805DRAFT_158003 [Annulohypoxylon moriforme]|nr:hypothetical protein F4805DRAFT_158003 [Annulohypoxylon moriforme]
MEMFPWKLPCYQGDQKCHVQNCNNKRIITNAVVSPYCKHHICVVCFQQKTCFKRGHGEERLCRKHSCTHPNCHAPRSKKHSDSTYCAKHACSVRNCDQPRHGPGLNCRNHTCRSRGCINCVHPPSPSPHLSSPPEVGESMELSRHYYCPGHQPCQAPGCTNFAFQDPSHRAGRYCFRHHCAAAPGCEGQRVDAGGDAVACRDHTCALYPSCTEPRVDAERGLFCENHECAEDRCRKQRYDSGTIGYAGATVGVGLGSGVRTGTGGVVKAGKGIWCADHMCMAALTRQEDCPNRREGTPTNPMYCADHELCEEVGCSAFCAVRDRGKRLARCEEHLKSKCAFPSCTLDAEGNTAACRYHVCRANGCLTMLAATITATSLRTSLFCDAHRCVESECTNQRLSTTISPTTNLTTAVPAMPTLPPGDYRNMFCAEHVYQRRMALGLGFGSCMCPCHFGVKRGGSCCRCHNDSSGDDDSSDDDDTITDHGGSSSKCNSCVKR